MSSSGPSSVSNPAGSGSSIATSNNNARLGDVCFNKMEKANGELFAMTYGALVARLVRDHEDVDQVNAQLERIGYNIGQRLIDEFLSKSGIQRCGTFAETADIVARVGFKMFLGIAPQVVMAEDNKSFTLIFRDNNPLEQFVELPEALAGRLHYSGMLSGVVRGALEAVSLKVSCVFDKDALQGDLSTELRVVLEEVLEDVAGDEYREE